MSSNPTYEARVLSMIVLTKDEPVFAEGATVLRIDDEAAGEFVSVEQTSHELGHQQIRICRDDWPHIREAIEQLIGACRS